VPASPKFCRRRAICSRPAPIAATVAASISIARVFCHRLFCVLLLFAFFQARLAVNGRQKRKQAPRRQLLNLTQILDISPLINTLLQDCLQAVKLKLLSNLHWASGISPSRPSQAWTKARRLLIHHETREISLWIRDTLLICLPLRLLLLSRKSRNAGLEIDWALAILQSRASTKTGHQA